VEPTNILIGRSRNEREQGVQEIMMHLVRFVHGGTSMNLYNQPHVLIPFVEPSQHFLRHLKFVSPSGPPIKNELTGLTTNFRYLQALFESFGIMLTVFDPSEDNTAEQKLTDDVLALLVSFSGRLYGMRSHNQPLP